MFSLRQRAGFLIEMHLDLCEGVQHAYLSARFLRWMHRLWRLPRFVKTSLLNQMHSMHA